MYDFRQHVMLRFFLLILSDVLCISVSVWIEVSDKSLILNNNAQCEHVGESLATLDHVQISINRVNLLYIHRTCHKQIICRKR